ncbi:MAG: PilN domain-containing protein [Elusimicrobiota bacterium]
MIKVNLVPSELLARAKQRQLVLQGVLLGTVLALGVTGVSFGHWYGKHRLEQNLIEQEAELQRLDAIVKQVEELEKAANAVRARLGVIEDLLLGRAYYPIFMSEFARSVPAGVRVNSVSTAGQGAGAIKLNIGAVANTNEDIAGWVKTMEKNPKFSSVEIGNVTATAGLYVFGLTATYTSK